MDTLYSSLLLASLSFICASIPSPNAFYRWFGVSTTASSVFSLIFIGTLFVHFINPRNTVYFTVLICANAWMYLHSIHNPRRISIVRRTIVGFVLSGLSWKLAVWYPFMKWHNVSVNVVDALLWFTVIHALCPRGDDKVGSICAGFLSNVWLNAIIMEFKAENLPRFTFDTTWTDLTNVWWLTLFLTFGVRLSSMWLTKVKWRVFKPSI